MGQQLTRWALWTVESHQERAVPEGRWSRLGDSSRRIPHHVRTEVGAMQEGNIGSERGEGKPVGLPGECGIVAMPPYWGVDLYEC